MKNVKIEWCENFIKSVSRSTFLLKTAASRLVVFGAWQSVPVFGNVERMALRCHQLLKN